MTVAGQPVVTYAYDNADRLITIVQGSNVVTITYDVAGRRTRVTMPNDFGTEYTYDAASRATGLTYRQGTNTLGTLSYMYDAAGNRLRVGGTWARTGLPPALAVASYDPANRHLSFGGQTLTYDLNGSLLSDGTSGYAWDARNRLTGITGPITATFHYDAIGRRTRKTINSVTTDFLHDGINPVTESTPLSTAFLLTGLGVDEFLLRIGPAGTSMFLTDALGSLVATTNSAGLVQSEVTYEPFGATDISPPAPAYRFTGREHDEPLYFYYYRARYYHTDLQRFISEDPIGFAGGDVNLYGYVGNGPTNLIDPTGEFIFLPPVAAVGAAVALGVALTAVLTSGGDTSPSPPVLSGRKHDQPSQYVVRGGLAKPEDLIKGTGPHRDIPGLTGFSVQHRPGLSVDELAREGQFPNLQISVTTVPILRRHGFNVVYPTPGRGRYHATVQTPYPLTFEQAVLLNSLFVQQANPYPYRAR